MRRTFLLGAVFSLLFAVAVSAQNSGSITGTVVDQKGGSIAGASVKAIDESKGLIASETKTTAEGFFTLQPLQPGTYTVRVNAPGMKELENKGLVLDQRQVLGVGTLTMTLGATTESVTVEAITPLVETATSDHSNVLDQKQVEETLLNGRDFQSLMKTLPGVVSNNGSDFQLQFNNTDQMHINGMRGSDNNVFLDGAINTDVGANDGQYTQLSMDAVGEFKVQTSNFAAEYGRNPGVLIAIDTKSGGQQYHGTLYEFNREDGFGANPYGQSTTAFLRFNQYGGNLGGPIIVPKLSPRREKKMFFFFNYEGTRGIRPGNTQFANKVLPGVGQGYDLPNPAEIGGLGATPTAFDFTSAYQFCPPGATTSTNANCLPGTTGNPEIIPGGTGYQVGQIFVPGTVQFAPNGNIIAGTPICGTPTAPCNVIPANSTYLSNQMQAWRNYWIPHYLTGYVPDPSSTNNNPAGALDGNVFNLYNERYTLNKRQLVIRYDWNISPKNNFFFRWVDDAQTEFYHNLFDYADYPILPEYRKKPGSSWSWNLVSTISPTTTNEFIFSYNHLTQVVDITPGTSTSTYGFSQLGFTFQQLYPGSNVDDRAPVLNNCCNGTFTGGSFHPSWASEARTFTWTDNVTQIHGPHTFKFGVFFDYNQAGQQPVWEDAPYLQFNTGSSNPNDSNNYIANVLFGNFTQAQQTNGVFFGAFRFHQVEGFGEDTWKVTRRLTLDLGLRWGYMGPTYTVKPFFQNYFDPQNYNPAEAVTLNTTGGNYFGDICSAALQALPGGQCPGVTNFGNPFNGITEEGHGLPLGGVKHRWDNFGPRFGFAYDVFGDGKTAIRGGAGIFYERIRQNNNSFDALGNPPLSYTATVFNGKLDDLGPQDITGVLSPSSVNAFEEDGHIPTIYGYSLGVQRELPFQIGLDVSYVGNMGRHLLFWYNLNSLPIGCDPLFDASTSCGPSKPTTFYVPYPGYSTINYTQFAANSSYNSLQAKAVRRFGKDLTLSSSFVWSKAMDLEDDDNGNINATNGGGNNLTDPYNPKSDWARAGFDRKFTFDLNSIYAVPDFTHSKGLLRYATQGWQWGTLWKWWSGVPLDVTMTGEAGNFIGVVRPDLVKGVPIYLSHGTRLNWFNPAAFAEPAPGSVGDIGRNAFTGPGVNNWDMSLFKNFNFTEHMYLQLRLEVYNIFNHPQPNSVNVGFTAASGNSPGALPNYSISSSGQYSQGQINGFRDMRSMQLGAKFYF